MFEKENYISNIRKFKTQIKRYRCGKNSTTTWRSSSTGRGTANSMTRSWSSSLRREKRRRRRPNAREIKLVLPVRLTIKGHVQHPPDTTGAVKPEATADTADRRPRLTGAAVSASTEAAGGPTSRTETPGTSSATSATSPGTDTETAPELSKLHLITHTHKPFKT